MVLSFHESFEYVQGAMRLGAIDYISKLRLEQEDCKEVFLRVARLLGCREGERPAEEGVPSQTLEELRQSWESLHWVYDDIRFQEQGERLEKLGVSLEVEEEAVALLARGGSGEQGARPLRRAVAARVEDPAADLLLSGALKKGGKLRVAAREGEVRVELGVRN